MRERERDKQGVRVRGKNNYKRNYIYLNFSTQLYLSVTCNSALFFPDFYWLIAELVQYDVTESASNT